MFANSINTFYDSIGSHGNIVAYVDPKNEDTENNQPKLISDWKYYFFANPDLLREDNGEVAYFEDPDSQTLKLIVQLYTQDDKEDALLFIKSKHSMKSGIEKIKLSNLYYLPIQEIRVDVNQVLNLLPDGIRLCSDSKMFQFANHGNDVCLSIFFGYDNEKAKTHFLKILKTLKITLTFYISGKRAQFNRFEITGSIFNGTLFKSKLDGVKADSDGNKYIRRSDLRQLIKQSKIAINIQSYIELNNRDQELTRNKIYEQLDQWMTNQDRDLVEWKDTMIASTYNADDLKANLQKYLQAKQKQLSENRPERLGVEKTSGKISGIVPIGGAQESSDTSHSSKNESKNSVEVDGEIYTPKSIMVVRLNDNIFTSNITLASVETYVADRDLFVQYDISLGQSRQTAAKLEADTEYKGELLNGKPHGKGKMTYKDKNMYEGDFQDGYRHGTGIETFSDGSVYDGDWKNNTRDGRGRETWPDGLLYEGDWHSGRPHGRGRSTFSDKSVYEGDFKDGRPHGRGIETWEDGRVYDGDWVNGHKQHWGEGYTPNYFL